MNTPTQDIPKLEAIYTMDDIVKQIEASGVNLGDDPAKKIGTFIDNGLLPQPKNGRFASFVVQRIIAIQNKLQEGKSISELKDEVSKERRRFLNQVTDLNSMVNLYRKFSNNSLFFLASLLLVAMVSIGILGAGLTGSSNPVIVAGESIVKAVINSGSQIAKTASAPLGRTLVTIIKTSKPAESSTLDPLGLTNLDEKEFVIPENLVSLNEGGGIELNGSITANNFFGDLLWSSVVERPTVLSAIDGVENDGGNIDLVAGSGITILSDDDVNTITFSSIDNSSSQFIFKNIAISGQSNIVADLNNDTLTFVAGSNVSLTTDPATDSLTIGVTGTVSNADTLDLLDSTAFLRSDTSDAFTSGTLTTNTGTTLDINGTLAWGGTTINQNLNMNNNLITNIGNSGTDFNVLGGLTLASSLVVSSGSININSGGIVNTGSISGASTIDASGDVTLIDLTNPSGPDFTINRLTEATVIQDTISSGRIILEGAYWNGAASIPVKMQILTRVDDTTPTYKIAFMNDANTVVVSIFNNGDLQLNGGSLTLLSGGDITTDDIAVNGGDIISTASQLILQATGANADVVVQGGLCIRDATACNDVAAGGLEVDTAGGTGDDPGDVFDIAEIYTAVEPVTQGEIVSAAGATKVKRSSGAYDQAVLGVTSSHPAALIDDRTFKVGVDPNKFNPNKPWVALAGRVPTKISAENGDVSPGDPLTSSSIPGVAMKATKSGPIVGKALESFPSTSSGQADGAQDDIGRIMVFVSTGWYVAPVADSSPPAGGSDVSNIDYETLSAQSISTQVLFVGERKISFGKNGALKIDGNVEVDGKILAQKISTDELVISSETSGNKEIIAGQKSVIIENDRVKENSKILVTFTSDYFPANRFWVSKKEGESFTVHLDQPTARNSTFDWLIIN